MIDLKLIRDAGGDEERGEPVPLTIDSRDVLQFERTTKGGSFDTLTKNVRFEHLYKAAWIAAKRTGAIQRDVSLEAFTEVYVMDLTGEQAEPDPTQTEA